MGWRFQKRIRILPGVTLNVSRKGVSTSVGTRGARMTLGHGQTRVTVGLPGTGISHTSISRTRTKTLPLQSDTPPSSLYQVPPRNSARPGVSWRFMLVVFGLLFALLVLAGALRGVLR